MTFSWSGLSVWEFDAWNWVSSGKSFEKSRLGLIDFFRPKPKAEPEGG